MVQQGQFKLSQMTHNKNTTNTTVSMHPSLKKCILTSNNDR